jgi:hypothetical protein
MVVMMWIGQSECMMGALTSSLRNRLFSWAETALIPTERTMTKSLFTSFPVAEASASTALYKALGFSQNPHFRSQPKEFAAAVARCGVAVARAPLLAAAMLGIVIPGAAQECRPAPSSREDIYALHGVREERIVKSNWCTSERAGFALLAGDALEELFGLWSVRTEPQAGRIADPKASKVGEFRTCTAVTLDHRVLNFYAEGKLAELPFTGNGECRLVQADYPERGIAALRCHLNLHGLPSGYQGGLATSNTLVSEAVLGGETDPPGYLQTSIATFRLWRALRGDE